MFILTDRGILGLSWLALLVSGVIVGLAIDDQFSFFNKDKWNLKAPDGSDSQKAEKRFRELFPERATRQFFSIAVVMSPVQSSNQWPQGAIQTDPRMYFLTADILDASIGSCKRNPWKKCYYRRAQGWWVDPSGLEAQNVTDVQRLLGKQFVSGDGRSTLLMIEVWAGIYDDAEAAQWDAMEQAAASSLDKLGLNGVLQITFTMEDMQLQDASKHVISDFEHGDMVTLPLAWVLLLVAVGPPALLVLVTLAVSACGSFLLLGQIANQRQFANFTPSIFVCMLIALTLDYGLFTLARYREEMMLRGYKGSHYEAVRAAAASTTRVIFVSGAILAACFAGLGLIQMDMVANIGLGGAVMVCVVVLVNLCLLPALLVLFGGCCKPLLLRWPRCVCCVGKALTSGTFTPLLSRHSDIDCVGPGDPLWLRLGVWTRRWRIPVVLAILVLTGFPFAWLASRLCISLDQTQLVPRDGDSLVAIGQLSNLGLPDGLINPLYVSMASQPSDLDSASLPFVDDDLDLGQALMGWRSLPCAPGLCTCAELEDNCTTTMLEGLLEVFCPATCPLLFPPCYSVVGETFFAATRALRAQVKQLSGLSDEHIIDIASDMTGAPITADTALQWLVSNNSEYNSTEGIAYRARFDALTSRDRTSALMEVVVPGKSFGKQMVSALRSLRQVNTLDQTGMRETFVVSPTSELMDAVDKVFEETPPMLVGVVVVVVFVFAALVFRSILIPARLLLTIAVTSVWVAGATVVVFQDILRVEGIYWLAPVCCAPLIVGLTVDYDIFVVSRVYEYRKAGFSTEASIIRGLHRTGGVVTMAGLLMTTAFSALLLSKETVLNQFGFVLVCGALIDTLVVRALLVPALLQCAVEYTWWPNKLPPGLRLDVRGPESGLQDDDSPERPLWPVL